MSSDALVVLRDDDATIKRPFREFEQAEDADVRILAAKADAPCQPIDPRAVATDRTTVTA